ncbi:MAG: shikimate kinase AroK [Aureliella sp.]
MHLYLMGYRGSGKTTVGKRLALATGSQWLDSDEMIVERAKMSIKEIFDSSGEQSFRDLETQVIQQIAEQSPTDSASLVVSLGGGAILRLENRQALQASGRCVWLSGSPESLWRRINSDDASAASRPNLTDHDGYKEVEEVLAARAPIYQELADFTVNTDHRSPDEIVEEILLWAKSAA